MRFPLSRAVLALAVMALAMVVAFVGTAICRALLEARGVEGFRHYPEIFARLFVLVLVAAWLVHGWKTRGGLFATDAPRWLRLSLWALLAGFLTSALDPWSPISDEMNVVRYSTSGFLLLASATLFAAQLGRIPLVDRAVELGFALVLGFAAADEVLQLHESAGAALASTQPTVMTLNTQDTITLSVAVAGLILAALAQGVLRRLGRSDRLRDGERYARATGLFTLAGLAFFAAMLLDTFDWNLERGFLAVVRTLVPQAAAMPFYALSDTDHAIMRAANSLEEFLELTSAMLLFFMARAFVSREPVRTA